MSTQPTRGSRLRSAGQARLDALPPWWKRRQTRDAARAYLHLDKVPGAVFIPNDTFALVDPSMGEWVCVFAIEGFRYDPATDLSLPVVITQAMAGARTHGATGSTFMVPRWPGIVFGRDVDETSLPPGIREQARRLSEVASEALMARLDMEHADLYEQ